MMEVAASPEEAARVAARIVADAARTAVAERGRFTIALSGGRTPWAMVEALGDEDVPWLQTAVFQTDERVAPFGDPDRNLTHLGRSLPDLSAEVHPMPVEDVDLEAAARRYAAKLPDRFDMVHLGLGPDGHTASLVPGDPVLQVRDRDVALTAGYLGRRRMTLTYRAIDRARAALWLVTGEDKRDALARLRAGDMSIPAGRVATARQIIVADVAATRPAD
jgi:6-phosphogluconolactonase